MTGSQVFLRFIKDEISREDGTANMQKYRFWKKGFKRHYVIKKYKPLSSVVENFLSDEDNKGYRHSLRGFLSLFLNFWPYNIRYSTYHEKSAIVKRWNKYLNEHIDGPYRNMYSKDKEFFYSWKA